MNAIDKSSREAINHEAALWHARLDSGSADVDAFEAWRIPIRPIPLRLRE